MGDDVSKLKDDLDDFNDGLNDSSRIAKELIQVFKNINKEVKDLKGDADISEFIKENTRLLKDTDKQYSNISNNITKVLQGEAELKDVRKQQESLNNSINKLTNTIRINHAKILTLQKDGSAESKKALAALELQNNELRDQFSTLKSNSKEFSKVADYQQKISDATSVTGKALHTIGHIFPGIGDAAHKASHEMEHFAAHQLQSEKGLRGMPLQFMTVAKGVGILGRELMKAFSGPEAIVHFLLHSFIHVDETITKIGKSMGITKSEALQVEASFKMIALDSQYSSVSIGTLTEGMLQLSETTKVTAGFTKEMLEQQVVMTKQLGLSADESAKINSLSMMNNKSTQETKIGIANQVKNLERQTGIRLNYKKVMQDVSKIDGALALQYKNNPELIAKAVIQAQKLGITLEKSAQMSAQILNWESSIEAELEAELLTGKQLNLTEARNLALKGKSAEAAASMLQQVGSAAEFSQMDVIAQESIAKSMGMQRDELANSLREKELLTKLGAQNIEQLAKEGRLDELRNQEGGEALVRAYEQQTAQEKMNQAMIKLSEILGALVAGPLGTMMDVLASILSSTTGIYSIMGAIGGIMFAKLIPAFKTLGLTLKAIKLQSIGTAIMSAIQAIWTSLGAIPFVGPALAGAAIMGAIGFIRSKSMDDGAMGPDGKILYSKKEGAIKLNDKDTVIAGTDLGGETGNSNSSKSRNTGGSGNDLSPLLAKVDQLISLLQAGSKVTLDGKEVGKALGLNSINANIA